MRKNRSLSWIGGFTILFALNPLYAQDIQKAQDLPVLLIEDTRLEAPFTSATILEDRAKGPVSDGGELLKTFPGISAIRMGNHGLDPVIRGQQHNRINVLIDGAYVHGGCPNRMDPPSAYAASETFDRVVVDKGVQSLAFGDGGSGGTVRFERDLLKFGEDFGYQGKTGAGYTGNSQAREAFLDFAMGNKNIYGRFIGNLNRGEDYKTGNDQTVRASYRERSGHMTLALTPSEDHNLKLDYTVTRARDLTYAGAGMDTPYTDNDTWQIKWNLQRPGSLLSALKAEFYLSQVDHLMDNYSLRSVGAMYMRAPSNSDTWGGRIHLQLKTAATDWLIGLDYQNNQREAIRYAGGTEAAALTTIQSYLWPQVTIATTGLFAEVSRNFADTRMIKAGLRWNHVSAEAKKTDIDPSGAMNVSADTLYNRYYGYGYAAQSENNISALFRFEQDFMDGEATFYTTLSRSVRTADATERFMAGNNMTAASRWVGNPAIDPEKHHQFEIGLLGEYNDWNFDGNLNADYVQDFILRDRAHSTDATVGNATIYRNVKALLWGGELAINRHWNNHLKSGLSLSYIHAENRTDNRAVAQIPPLEIGLTTDYKGEMWNFGGKLRLVKSQTRLDNDTSVGSGLDANSSPGFATLDLYGQVTPVGDMKIKFGVNNLLDHHYAEHLNRSNTFDADQVRVYEPGRHFWLSGSMTF
ncbi:TonB-dependent copper receptor [Magnetococcales bacterium HHB-1]